MALYSNNRTTNPLIVYTCPLNAVIKDGFLNYLFYEIILKASCATFNTESPSKTYHCIVLLSQKSKVILNRRCLLHQTERKTR